jgi:hypothetical protein
VKVTLGGGIGGGIGGGGGRKGQQPVTVSATPAMLQAVQVVRTHASIRVQWQDGR